MQRRIFSGTLVPESKKLKGIHGLRAFAALMVVMLHLHFWVVPAPKSFAFIQHILPFGVHLFFVLSAFSLAYSMKYSHDGIREYAIKRFFRIAPLFYLLLIYAQFVNGPLTIPDLILNLTFTYNFAPRAFASGVWAGWSNGVEVIFYIILPTILAICRSRFTFLILALTSILISWAGHKYIMDSDPDAAKSMFLNYAWPAFISNFVAFAFGLLAFAVCRDTINRRLVGRISLGCAAILIALVAATPFANTFETPGRPGAIVLMAAFGLICISQALSPSWVTSNSLMQYIGERSYSVYLVHFPILSALAPIDQRIYASLPWMRNWAFLPVSALSISAVLAVAHITYRFVEVPGVNVGRRIIERCRRGLTIDHEAVVTVPAPALQHSVLSA